MSETELQRAVLELASRLGWATAHFRPGLTQTGRWVTAVQGDGVGFPDTVLVRDRIVFAELKAEGKYLKPEQKIWKTRLEKAGAEYHLWRPGDWKAGAIEGVLR